MLSALAGPLDPDLFAPYDHLVVEVDDVEDEDVLQHFARSNAFISEGLAGGGGVLVHWYETDRLLSPFLSPSSHWHFPNPLSLRDRNVTNLGTCVSAVKIP